MIGKRFILAQLKRDHKTIQFCNILKIKKIWKVIVSIGDFTEFAPRITHKWQKRAYMYEERSVFKSLVSAQTYCLANSFLHKGCIHSQPISPPQERNEKTQRLCQTMWARCQNTRAIRLICRISTRPLIHTTLLIVLLEERSHIAHCDKLFENCKMYWETGNWY